MWESGVSDSVKLPLRVDRCLMCGVLVIFDTRLVDGDPPGFLNGSYRFIYGDDGFFRQICPPTCRDTVALSVMAT